MKARSLQAELLDAPRHDPAELSHSLDQVAQVNRWLGGTRALRRHLAPWLRTLPAARILDVGTGNGVTLREVTAWALSRGSAWTGIGVDIGRQTAELARDAGSSVVLGDALRLPFADGSFDVALCTLTLHHFPDDDAVPRSWATSVAAPASPTFGYAVISPGGWSWRGGREPPRSRRPGGRRRPGGEYLRPSPGPWRMARAGGGPGSIPPGQSVR